MVSEFLVESQKYFVTINGHKKLGRVKIFVTVNCVRQRKICLKFVFLRKKKSEPNFVGNCTIFLKFIYFQGLCLRQRQKTCFLRPWKYSALATPSSNYKITRNVHQIPPPIFPPLLLSITQTQTQPWHFFCLLVKLWKPNPFYQLSNTTRCRHFMQNSWYSSLPYHRHTTSCVFGPRVFTISIVWRTASPRTICCDCTHDVPGKSRLQSTRLRKGISPEGKGFGPL